MLKDLKTILVHLFFLNPQNSSRSDPSSSFKIKATLIKAFIFQNGKEKNVFKRFMI